MSEPPVYDKEGFYQECLKEKPALTREQFEARWNHFWFIAQVMGLVRRKKNG